IALSYEARGCPTGCAGLGKRVPRAPPLCGAAHEARGRWRKFDMTTRMKVLGAAALSLGLAASAGAAHAQAEFFKDKTINLYVGYSSGGGYDVYARMVARFMGAHIPG